MSQTRRELFRRAVVKPSNPGGFGRGSYFTEKATEAVTFSQAMSILPLVSLALSEILRVSIKAGGLPIVMATEFHTAMEQGHGGRVPSFVLTAKYVRFPDGSRKLAVVRSFRVAPRPALQSPFPRRLP